MIARATTPLVLVAVAVAVVVLATYVIAQRQAPDAGWPPADDLEADQ